MNGRKEKATGGEPVARLGALASACVQPHSTTSPALGQPYLTCPGDELKHRDYEAWWAARRRFLLAQAAIYGGQGGQR